MSDLIEVVFTRKSYGWTLRHPASGYYFLSAGLRQRRFAVQARAEFLATGVDWSRAEQSDTDRAKSAGVFRKWDGRVKSCCIDAETGEFYGNGPGSSRLSTPDGEFSCWGAPSGKLAAEYAARRAAGTWAYAGHTFGGGFGVADLEDCLALDALRPAIAALRDEAARAGDLEQAAACERVLRGDRAARAECERVMADAAAQR
jgi:hypothetical protein